jgi:23S rRNA (cytidine1920-2'-O)/16S rRNA (cytidine1409-2'-O)-methyltransferase
MRLDIFLVEHKFYETRNKAQNAIKNNLILVNGKVINKYNYFAKNTDLITKIETDEYVSRGAYKLLEAIKH